ncbi:MAG TPA: DUF362 domain-containing protein [Armatimonadota bacterium]|jgi:uncharacterized protein (DUF362 family)
MPPSCSRREFLRASADALGLAALAAASSPLLGQTTAPPPSLPVAIGRCATYDQATVTRTLATLLDQIGGLKKLVAGRTVTIKVNATGGPERMMGKLPIDTFHTHPAVVRAAIELMAKAGARRIRIVESSTWRRPLESYLQAGGWSIQAVKSAAPLVEFEDTRNLGRGKGYSRLKVPGGGLVFPAFDLNHSYADTDVLVSIPKLKLHSTAGVTVSMKNLFGITPNALYSDDAGSENATEARSHCLHMGRSQPAKGSPQAHPDAVRHAEDRVPRVVVDIVRARPIDLCIVDGIASMTGGEGPWQWPVKAISPKLLLVGRNPVCTDAISTAVVGHDPMAKRAVEPFPGDNHLALAAAAGLGTNDPSRIEVLGLPVKQALCPFGKVSREYDHW